MAQSHASQPLSHSVGAFAPSFDRLAVLHTLPRGWDTYDAEPIAGIAIERARVFLVALMERSVEATPTFIAPLPFGGVQLEWRRRGYEIELEIAPDGTLAYILGEGEGADRTFHEREGVSLDEAVNLVEQIFANG